MTFKVVHVHLKTCEIITNGQQVLMINRCVAKNLQLDGSFLKMVSVDAKTCQSIN
jgi:hypothetical protein